MGPILRCTDLSGEVSLPQADGLGTRLERLSKGEDDFATNADIEAERAMLRVLREHRPQDGVLSEEASVAGPDRAQRRWLVDPLCGTLNYAVRIRVAAVNVALMADQHFLAAAVADPFNQEIFFSDERGAFLRPDGRDVALSPSGGSRLVDLNLDPPLPNAQRFRETDLAGHPEFSARFRPRVSSTMALTWVASGQRAAYITDGHIMDKSVHFAAGLAICEAAACLVSDLWGQPWGDGASGLVACADAGTHELLMELVRDCAPRGRRGPDQGSVTEKPQEAARQNAAVQERAELPFNESGNRAVALLPPGEERLKFVGEQPVEHGCFRIAGAVWDADGHEGLRSGTPARESRRRVLSRIR